MGPVPRAWKAYALGLAALSLPFFVRGLFALPSAPVGRLFTLPLFPLLILANLCVLQLPPHRFLHFTTGVIVFGGFFITGPAILGLLLLAIPLSEALVRFLERTTRFRPRLGTGPDQYVVPAATIGLTLGAVDAFHRSLGVSYPLRPADVGADGRLFGLLWLIYGSVVLFTECGIYLRFGWQEAFATRHSRRDLVVYLLAILLGAPVVVAIVRAEGPEIDQTLWSLAWVLWAFGAFAVADIFIRRQIEIERLVGAIARQERLATLGRLVSVIAHQTRHHLGILNMSAYVLDETLAKEALSPVGREAVGRELEVMQRTRDELGQLLTQELRGGLHEQTFGLMALARECGADLTPMARGRGVGFSYVGGEQQIRGDRLRLKQAVSNVLRNAIEAAPTGSEVAVTIAAESSDVRLSIRDEGAGLSQSAQTHLFDPLFTEKTDGLGMGLYVAQAIVEAHGGRLALTNEDRGTRAEIRLARELPADSQ